MNLIKFHSVGIIYILCTSNNTLITVSDLKGRVLFSCSNGWLGMKGAKRSTSYASQNLGYFVGKKLNVLGYKYVYVKVKGLGFSRFSCLKGIHYSGLKILCVLDITTFSFNGCKRPKKRRL